MIGATAGAVVAYLIVLPPAPLALAPAVLGALHGLIADAGDGLPRGPPGVIPHVPLRLRDA